MLCLICPKMIAIFWEYNIKWQYSTIHEYDLAAIQVMQELQIFPKKNFNQDNLYFMLLEFNINKINNVLLLHFA